MTAPPIFVILPTQGRATLERALRSGQAQMGPGDRYVVVIDSHGMDHETLLTVVERVEAFGRQFSAMALDAGHNCWGHCQINLGLEAAVADGAYIVHMDDDDIHAPEAFELIRQAIADDVVHGSPRLHVFRFVTYWGAVLPVGPSLAEGHVGGHCIVGPADHAGTFKCRYNGDWDYIKGTVDAWGGDGSPGIVFEDGIIAICRPGPATEG